MYIYYAGAVNFVFYCTNIVNECSLKLQTAVLFCIHIKMFTIQSEVNLDGAFYLNRIIMLRGESHDMFAPTNIF